MSREHCAVSRVNFHKFSMLSLDILTKDRKDWWETLEPFVDKGGKLFYNTIKVTLRRFWRRAGLGALENRAMVKGSSCLNRRFVYYGF